MDPGTFPAPRLTPWVGRLLAAMVGVQLLLATIFVSPAVTDALMFDPAHWAGRPWTALTYAFVHGGVLHLLFNGLALFFFGPAVERRLGGPAFLFYFLYCVVGAAAFAAVLQRLYPVPPFIGASGGVIGVLLAYSIIHPDRELFAFPIPVPIRARTMVLLVAIFDLAGVFFLRDLFHTTIAHEAHLGGLAFGWLFFRLQGMGRPQPQFTRPKPVVEHHVAVGGRESDRLTARPPDHRPPAIDKAQAELDRVLDKISATGMGSLTPSERKYLDEVAKKKKDT
ncbi:MAG: rhomboid family intramembrane serine protease [Gemmatimonadales bacterium]